MFSCSYLKPMEFYYIIDCPMLQSIKVIMKNLCEFKRVSFSPAKKRTPINVVLISKFWQLKSILIELVQCELMRWTKENFYPDFTLNCRCESFFSLLSLAFVIFFCVFGIPRENQPMIYMLIDVMVVNKRIHYSDFLIHLLESVFVCVRERAWSTEHIGCTVNTILPR